MFFPQEMQLKKNNRACLFCVTWRPGILRSPFNGFTTTKTCRSQMTGDIKRWCLVKPPGAHFPIHTRVFSKSLRLNSFFFYLASENGWVSRQRGLQCNTMYCNYTKEEEVNCWPERWDTFVVSHKPNYPGTSNSHVTFVKHYKKKGILLLYVLMITFILLLIVIILFDMSHVCKGVTPLYWCTCTNLRMVLCTVVKAVIYMLCSLFSLFLRRNPTKPQTNAKYEQHSLKSANVAVAVHGMRVCVCVFILSICSRGLHAGKEGRIKSLK